MGDKLSHFAARTRSLSTPRHVSACCSAVSSTWLTRCPTAQQCSSCTWITMCATSTCRTSCASCSPPLSVPQPGCAAWGTCPRHQTRMATMLAFATTMRTWCTARRRTARWWRCCEGLANMQRHTMRHCGSQGPWCGCRWGRARTGPLRSVYGSACQRRARQVHMNVGSQACMRTCAQVVDAASVTDPPRRRSPSQLLVRRLGEMHRL